MYFCTFYTRLYRMYFWLTLCINLYSIICSLIFKLTQHFLEEGHLSVQTKLFRNFKISFQYYISLSQRMKCKQNKNSHSQKAAANRLTEGRNYLVNKTSNIVYNYKPSKRMDIKNYLTTYFKVFRHIFGD